ncbi:MAG: hypothetical protein EXR71_09865 [Myxococcales bacterium]|nr:hypothetical protein [Myxococcales bacterium]
MALPSTPGTWSLITFTADGAAIAALGELHARHPTFRYVAIVPTAMDAPPGVALLVDVGGRLATALGVHTTYSYVVDGRGTISHQWHGVPEAEAVAVYAERPAMPSGAPPWLFPVLAALVLIAGIGAWAATRTPNTPVPPALITPIADVTVSPPADAVDDGEDDAGDEEAAPAAAGGGKRRVRGNKVGEWAIRPPKAAAESATLDGDTLILSASAEATRSACKGPMELTGPVTVEAEWKLDGISGGVAKLVARQADANGKVIRGPTGRSMVARGKGTGQWKAVTATVTPADGAAKLFVCLELDKGAGSASIRGVRP